MQEFLDGSQELDFPAEGRAAIYAWVERTLRPQRYPKLSRKSKGLVRRYIAKMTGLSRAQLTRLIHKFLKTQEVKPTVYRRRRFRRRDTTADVATLVAVDQAHGRLSGPAACAILKREYEVFGNQQCKRLAAISNGHLYNLRNSAGYPAAAHRRHHQEPDARLDRGTAQADVRRPAGLCADRHRAQR